MLFLVWGYRRISKTIHKGVLQCPLCKIETPYEFKIARKYFTLFWLPLFPYGKSVEYVECQRCDTPFNPEFFGLDSSQFNENKDQSEEESE
jgi:hypothetical protein